MPGTPTGPRYSCIIPDPADRLSRMDRPPLGALDHRHADQPDPVLYQLAVTLLRRLGRSWIYRRVRKTADVQRICLATSDRHRILRTGVPRGTCQVPGISKTTQAVSISCTVRHCHDVNMTRMRDRAEYAAIVSRSKTRAALEQLPEECRIFVSDRCCDIIG